MRGYPRPGGEMRLHAPHAFYVGKKQRQGLLVFSLPAAFIVADGKFAKHLPGLRFGDEKGLNYERL